MKYLEEEFPAASRTQTDDAERRRENVRPKRREPPLTTFESADDLYAAMGAARRANLAMLAGEAQPGQAAASTRRGDGRLLRWGLISLALVAAVSTACRRGRRSE